MSFIAGRFAMFVVAGEATMLAVVFGQNSFVTFVAPILVIVVAGFFTLRSNVAKIWRENYEAKVEEVKVTSSELGVAHSTITRLQGQVADLSTQLSVEHGKTDLTPIMGQLDRQYDLLVDLVRTLKEGRPPNGEEH